MLLNRLEFALMNNPVRTAFQRRFEAPRLLDMGGPMDGGRALEIGCGRGIGISLILDQFRADSVDAFDLDSRMVVRARTRTRSRDSQARLWVGDAGAIPVASETYDAVFDFGIIHHVPDWRRTLIEIHRVLKTGGRFYAEEVLDPFIAHSIVRRLLRHPKTDRFDSAQFCRALHEAGLSTGSTREMLGVLLWVVATKKHVDSAKTWTHRP